MSGGGRGRNGNHVEPIGMKIGIIGLGRMGGNIARRLMRGGHEVVVWDRNAEAVSALGGEGAITATSLDDVRDKLDKPAIFWVMLPAGAPTEETIQALCGDTCAEGDIIIDGGNTFWKDDVRRAKALAEKGVHYVDVGTSGGVWGLERGYCMMIGGDKETVDLLDPIFDTLAPGVGSVSRTPNRSEDCDPRAEKGYIHAGRAGAGHFVKMVHNGIEYGLMQAYAEGFDVLWGRNVKHLPEDERFEFNLAEISEVWRRGSVISSWLLDLTASALAQDQTLSNFSGNVADSGEGRWTIDAAMEQATPVAVLTTALFARYRSRIDDMYGDKLLSAMRFGFGGHVEIPQ
ncbi:MULTISPECIES: phosphogluconate dehydrogenase (NAD(+)-dependent, decarboxylating) [Sphingomonas]